MPTRQTAAARMELAHREAVEVVKAHDSPERLAKLTALFRGPHGSSRSGG
jgi:hypothetical protein